MGATPKMVGFPNKPMGFPTKNDHFGVFWGYHHLRKHPYLNDIWLFPFIPHSDIVFLMFLYLFPSFSYDILFWEVQHRTLQPAPFWYLWIQRLHWVYRASSPATRRRLDSGDLHPRKLPWQWKNNHLKMYHLLNMVIFQCHVSFQGGYSDSDSFHDEIPEIWTVGTTNTTSVYRLTFGLRELYRPPNPLTRGHFLDTQEAMWKKKRQLPTKRWKNI